MQPADVSWNKPFKDRIQSLHEEWLSPGDLPVTRNGNPAPPPPMVYLDWVVDAWKGISSEVIKNSFKSCGIGVSVDGSEDGMIHAFKEGGPCPEGIHLLKEERLNEEFNEMMKEIDEEIEETYDSDQDEAQEEDQEEVDNDDDK